MFDLIRRLLRLTKPVPALWEIPSFKNRGMSMGFIWNTHVGENEELPNINDVIIVLTSCSMGMTVSRDERYRIVDIVPAKIYNATRKYYSAIAVDEYGKETKITTSRICRMVDHPRIWIGVF